MYARVDGAVRSDGTFVLMEVELIEPYLFWSLFPRAVPAYCAAASYRMALALPRPLGAPASLSASGPVSPGSHVGLLHLDPCLLPAVCAIGLVELLARHAPSAFVQDTSHTSCLRVQVDPRVWSSLEVHFFVAAAADGAVAGVLHRAGVWVVPGTLPGQSHASILDVLLPVPVGSTPATSPRAAMVGVIEAVAAGALSSPGATGASVDFLAMVACVSRVIIRVVTAACSDVKGLSPDAVSVVPVVPSGEDFMVQFETSWAADSGATCIVVPDPFKLTPAHVERMMGHWQSTGPSQFLYHFLLSCFLVPCHEVLHLVQHAVGQVDREPLSFSAEHDASRANYSLLWAVLQDPTIAPVVPPSFPFLLLVTGMRKAQLYSSGWSDTAWLEYSEWMASFGLTAPRSAEVRDSASMVNQFKWVCAAEGFQKGPEDLTTQLQLCFQDRHGDVYARPVVPPHHLHVPAEGRGGALAAHNAPTGSSAGVLAAARALAP